MPERNRRFGRLFRRPIDKASNIDAYLFATVLQIRLDDSQRRVSHLDITTPDGKRLILASNREGPWNLFWQPWDGSGPAERLASSEFNQWWGDLSPDGKLLAFEERNDILLLPMEGEREPQPFLQTEFTERSPAFSPDGRFLAYESDESGQFEVYVRPVRGPGGKRQVSADGGSVPRWNPNNAELFYKNGDKMMVVTTDLTGEIELGRPRVLFERATLFRRFDVTLDGLRFLMIDESRAGPPPSRLILVQNWFEELERLVPTGN